MCGGHSCLVECREWPQLELNLDRLLGGRISASWRRLELEEFHGGEMESAGDHVTREALDGRVQVADIAVVEAAGGLDLVLRIGELVLEREEILVGFEVGIGLGDGENGLKSAGQGRFGLAFVGEPRRAHGGGAGRGYVLERGLLVGGISFDRIDQVRNEIVSALELDVYVGPRFLGAIDHSDQTVIGKDRPQDDEYYDG